MPTALQRILITRFSDAIQRSDALTAQKLGRSSKAIESARRVLSRAGSSCGHCFVLSLLGRLPTQTCMQHTATRCPTLPAYQRGQYFAFIYGVKRNPAQRPYVCEKCHLPGVGRDSLHGSLPGLAHPHRQLIGPMLWAICRADDDVCEAALIGLQVIGKGHHWDSPDGLSAWLADNDATPAPCSALGVMRFLDVYFNLSEIEPLHGE
ncbi:hypothetical protein GGF50DRAFT_60013 [Schizophyllum commune]